ncbi:jumonji protein [Mucor ambiguus]|uniref:JmjC domain-containing histone demethylation protein 1 n=1 Tax=Mucor ambiguus TaxID=91626 RepID=A0A0C9MK38_9FUNG|nr:jumonji protein [Mucor ambiguus]
MGGCRYCTPGAEGPIDKWIACDACQEWFHWHCLKLDNVDQIETYHCPECVLKHGPTTCEYLQEKNLLVHNYPTKAHKYSLDKPHQKQRKSSRSQARLNYADLNEGNAAGDERIWGKLLAVKSFKRDKFKRYTAKQVNMDLLRKTGLREPFVVEQNEPELDMRMPKSDITVYDIARLVGGDDHPVEVIDVASQSESPGWTMGRWAEYFHSKERDRIRNVISLEISGSDLADQITRPKIVRDMDWIDLMWPVEKHPEEFPKVQLYCLMGTKDSYTDFHIDFGGSSVFYHILSGAKTFYFIEPTPKNLKKYQKWSSTSEQSTTFLGDEVKECYQVKLTAGNTMIIPAGWIHAVYTPEDAIVIGGNFLQSFNIGTQLTVYAIEQVTNVPLKFRFPYYKRLNWYALAKFDTWLQHEETAKKLSYFELESIALLATFLHKDIKQNDEGEAIQKEGSVANADRKQLEIPDTIKDPIGLTKRVLKLVTTIIKEMSRQEKEQQKEQPPRKLVIRMKAPTPKPVVMPAKKQDEEEDDVYFHDEEEDDLEEDYKLDADDDEFNVEDEDYDEEDTMPITDNTNNSNTKIKKPFQRKANKKKTQIAHKQQETNDNSSSDDDSMGTSRSKSMDSISGLFSNRKRSLSNSGKSSQKSTKQRILDRVSRRH